MIAKLQTISVPNFIEKKERFMINMVRKELSVKHRVKILMLISMVAIFLMRTFSINSLEVVVAVEEEGNSNSTLISVINNSSNNSRKKNYLTIVMLLN